MDLRAAKADPLIVATYEAVSPAQRRRLLDGLDGFISHSSLSAGREARRRLARLVRYDAQERSWVKTQVASTPPIDPDRLAQLLRLTESSRIRELRSLRDLAGDP